MTGKNLHLHGRRGRQSRYLAQDLFPNAVATRVRISVLKSGFHLFRGRIGVEASVFARGRHLRVYGSIGTGLGAYSWDRTHRDRGESGDVGDFD